MAAKDTCRSSLGLLLCLSLAFFVANAVADGRKTLVLLDNPFIKETHSIFFNFLRGKFNCFCLQTIELGLNFGLGRLGKPIISILCGVNQI